MSAPSIPLFVPGGIGSPELILIFLIAILLFGANKIPKLARSTGQAIGEFQRGRQELEEELNEVADATSLDADATAETAGGTETEASSDETDAGDESAN